MSTENYSEPKRKPHTSNAVKQRYNSKNYRQWAAQIRPELHAHIEEYIQEHGISKRQFLEKAIALLEEK